MREPSKRAWALYFKAVKGDGVVTFDVKGTKCVVEGQLTAWEKWSTIRGERCLSASILRRASAHRSDGTRLVMCDGDPLLDYAHDAGGPSDYEANDREEAAWLVQEMLDRMAAHANGNDA